MHVILWKFIVRQECIAEFEAAYGPQGDWATLFGKAAGYRGTRLLHDTTSRGRYITLDYWASRQAHDNFLQQYQKEYRALDEHCQRLTIEECKLGEFDTEEPQIT
jgi:heme-degrading monooxygenase HmoA